jgi:2-aminoadipate transaminase
MTTTAASDAFRYARSMTAMAPARLRGVLARAASPGVISFAIGLPAEDLLPARELAEAQARLLPARPAALQYAMPHPRLKQQVVELMAARGVACSAAQVFLTSGSQQGMDLAARLFVDPGAGVVLEETVYEGMQLAVQRLGPRLLTVPIDLATGMEVEAVAAVFERLPRPALLYAIPAGHNPLGVSLGLAKRQRLLELARAFAVPVVEDDAYGFLAYDEAPPPPLRACEERWVLYLGSFSKILAPSLRAGWMVVPEELMPRLSALKHGADLDTPSLGHHLVSEYLESGDFPRHLARVRAEYRRRRDAMLECLATSLPPEVRWTRPASGMYVWVELPPACDAAALLETAIETERVAFIPGEAFAVAGNRHADHCLRLCFTACTTEQIAEGIQRLARAVARALASRPPRAIL